MSHITDNITDIDTRLATLEGHIKAIRQMVDSDKSCDDILLQLTAVKGGIDQLSKLILISHASTCVKSAIQNNDLVEYEHFVEVLKKYINK
ncbi:MAG: metal-sensitive transcriptional regulator [Clostridia bacterium]|nr:metal-sensitive transcriptional regulator [Clostridia bacterium]